MALIFGIEYLFAHQTRFLFECIFIRHDKTQIVLWVHAVAVNGYWQYISRTTRAHGRWFTRLPVCAHVFICHCNLYWEAMQLGFICCRWWRKQCSSNNRKLASKYITFSNSKIHFSQVSYQFCHSFSCSCSPSLSCSHALGMYAPNDYVLVHRIAWWAKGDIIKRNGSNFPSCTRIWFAFYKQANSISCAIMRKSNETRMAWMKTRVHLYLPIGQLLFNSSCLRHAFGIRTYFQKECE